ncbi:MAG: Hcp family type VI secretion system effector [Verrucomicrobiales bacterium]
MRTCKLTLGSLAVLAATCCLIPTNLSAAAFAKYDGVDGESSDRNHDKWIDVLSTDWGMDRPGSSGASRRRGDVVVRDFVLTMAYDKASPKLAEKCLKGEVIPKLEIEMTANYGGSRATYLKYELKNVMITSFQVSASGNDGADPPTVVISNNFEEIKVTYTEYDSSGNRGGNVEYQWKVEEGEKLVGVGDADPAEEP